jgi:hypothetical protein
MINRIAIVTKCNHCPHFDHSYYSYNQTCKKLNRRIENVDFTYDYEIPEDCPLPKTEENVDERTIHPHKG